MFTLFLPFCPLELNQLYFYCALSLSYSESPQKVNHSYWIGRCVEVLFFVTSPNQWLRSGLFCSLVYLCGQYRLRSKGYILKCHLDDASKGHEPSAVVCSYCILSLKVKGTWNHYNNVVVLVLGLQFLTLSCSFCASFQNFIKEMDGKTLYCMTSCWLLYFLTFRVWSFSVF